MEAKNQAKEAQCADREVRNEMDLGGGAYCFPGRSDRRFTEY